MNRRSVLRLALLLPWLAHGAAWAKTHLSRRVRPADPEWPTALDWQRLDAAVGGRLVAVTTPLARCVAAPDSAECSQLFAGLHNPYFIGDEPGLTQTLGWVDAWTFAPSRYAVAATSTGEVVAAVNFAREHNLRLVVKGGGHSYQGNSNSADSLLLWTRHMNALTVNEAFVPLGCTGVLARPAVTVEAGAIWEQVYDAITTQQGRYVQGGGCMTVGVAGLVQSGGFGSFSKGFGTAAGSLLEAEVVTADGAVRIANARTNPDLFWGIKGGGGAAFGVITKMTLATHDLPERFGIVNATIRAKSATAFRTLIGITLEFYKRQLFNAHWGEQIILKANRVLTVQMMSQGLDRAAMGELWNGFFTGIAARPDDFEFLSKPGIVDFPARHLWDPEFLKHVPGVTAQDDRSGADAHNVYWAGDAGQVGQVLHGYDSVWLPAALLADEKLHGLADALYAAANQWEVSLHFNKGLAGAPAAAIEAARDTAMNPAVLDAFALVIIAAEEPPAYPGIMGHEPRVAAARADAAGIHNAMAELRKVVPTFASYVAESNFFESEWQRAFWGDHYSRLLAVKSRYDPGGLFFGHHAVGSEAWSADGFVRNS